MVISAYTMADDEIMTDEVDIRKQRDVDVDVGKAWHQYEVIANELEYPFLSKEYMTKMFDYFLETLMCKRPTPTAVAASSECNNGGDGNQSSIGNILTCELCCDIYVDPVTLLCGHSFCRKCLKKREEELFIELCVKCDKRKTRRSRWSNFFKHSSFERFCPNVIINTLVKESFGDELKAIRLRLEGNEHYARSDLQKAEEKYKSAIEISPNSFISWSNLSQVKSSQGCYAESLVAAQRSIEICPFWAKGYYREGLALKQLSNHLGSLFSFLKYVILESSSAVVKDHLIESAMTVLQSEDIFSNDISIEEKHEKVGRVMKLVLEKGLEFTSADPSYLSPSRHNSKELPTDNLRNRFICVLCCRIFFDATTTPCGHSFCSMCLERSLDYNTSCSICRSSLVELITIKPKPVDVIIDGLVRKHFPNEYEESRQAALHESSTLKFEEENIATVPVFVCMATFPTLPCPLHVFEPRYKLMMRRCLDAPERSFGMCMYDALNGFKEYGTLLTINDSTLLDDGRLLIDAVGGKRFKVLDRGTRDGYSTAKVEVLKDEAVEITDELKMLHKSVYVESESFLNILPAVIKHTIRLKFGELPLNEGEDELTNEHGPKWMWFMIRLLSQTDDDHVNALKCNNLKERLLIVRRYIEKTRETMNAS